MQNYPILCNGCYSNLDVEHLEYHFVNSLKVQIKSTNTQLPKNSDIHPHSCHPEHKCVQLMTQWLFKYRKCVPFLIFIKFLSAFS